MRFKQLKIRNFKSLADVDLRELPDLVVFIGKNSSGKSNLLDALALMFLNFGTELEKEIGVQEYLFPDHLLQEDNLPEISVALSLTSQEWEYVFPSDQVDGEGFEEVELYLAKRIVPTQSGMLWRTQEVRVEPWKL